MERNYAIDFIKFFAILAVVVIHTFPSNHEYGYFVLDNFSRFAVPFFFTASGYFFGLKVSNNPKTANYFKRYIIKILKIYVSWLTFYFFYDVSRILIGGRNDKQELSQYLEGFTALKLLYYGEGTSGYQLWFVISLAWSIAVLYLFFKMKKIGLLLVIGLCLNIVGLFGQSYSIFFEMPVITRDALFIGLFYTTSGFWFSFSKPLKNSKELNKKTNFYLFCFFSFFQALEGYLLDKSLNARHGEFFLSTIFLTIFLFSFALNNPQLGKGLLITKIGGNALGIYAIHVLFIDIVDIMFNKLGLRPVSHTLLLNLLDAFLVLTLSYFSYHFIQYTKVRLAERVERRRNAG